MYARSWRAYAGSRRSMGLGGGGGGGGSGNEPGGAVENRVENLSSSNSGTGAETLPMVPEPNGAAPGGNDSSGSVGKETGPRGDEILADSGPNPSDPLTALPDDLIDLIDPIGGDMEGGDAKPHVSVPEPSTWGLFGIALLGMALGRRRKRPAGN
jgi:hypothetical protein